jgi:ABC-type nitrate/sulfonate/bicarbonate transport system substrate-binding protein
MLAQKLRCTIWLSLAALFVVGATLQVNAQQRTPIEIHASTIPTTDNGAFESARSKGFFEQEGVVIDTTPTSGGTVGIPALVAGQIELASSNIVSILLAASQGLGVQIVIAGDTGANEPPDIAGIAVKADSQMKSGADLNGKRIAVNARNNITWLYAREWIARNGGDPTKLTWVEIPFPQMVDAIQTGRVDAAVVVDPFLTVGVNKQLVKVLGWPYSTIQPHLPIAEFVTTQTYSEQHPDVIASLVRGYNRGVDWANANRTSPEFFNILSGYTKVDPDVLKGVAIPSFVKTVAVKDLQEIVRLMKKNGMLEGDVDVVNLINPSIREAN